MFVVVVINSAVVSSIVDVVVVVVVVDDDVVVVVVVLQRSSLPRPGRANHQRLPRRLLCFSPKKLRLVDTVNDPI